METSSLYPVEVGDQIIDCQTLEDRKAILEAEIVATDSNEASAFTRLQLEKMSAICRRYGLTEMAQKTAELAAESNS